MGDGRTMGGNAATGSMETRQARLLELVSSTDGRVGAWVRAYPDGMDLRIADPAAQLREYYLNCGHAQFAAALHVRTGWQIVAAYGPGKEPGDQPTRWLCRLPVGTLADASGTGRSHFDVARGITDDGRGVRFEASSLEACVTGHPTTPENHAFARVHVRMLLPDA